MVICDYPYVMRKVRGHIQDAWDSLLKSHFSLWEILTSNVPNLTTFKIPNDLMNLRLPWLLLLIMCTLIEK